MPKEVWRDGYLQVNGVDLSDHCSAITVDTSAEEIDLTSFTTSGYREIGQGFKSASIGATLFQDFAAASVHATLQPLYDSGGTFTVYAKQHQTATSATNPRVTLGTARLFGYSPFGGGIGEANVVEVQFMNAGTAGITYGTTGSP